MRKTAKLLTVTVLVAVLIVSNGNAQEKKFIKGDKNISLGVGFGSPWIGDGNSMTFPPVSASFDYGLRDDLGPGVIGIGGLIGVAGYRYDNLPYYAWSYTTVIVGARGTYHYQLVDKLDTYGGLMLGFRVISSKKYGEWAHAEYYDDDDVKLAGAFFVGAKYYFTENLAAFGELGYGVGIFTMGVTYKIGAKVVSE